jgi:hypothetical protein
VLERLDVELVVVATDKVLEIVLVVAGAVVLELTLIVTTLN